MRLKIDLHVHTCYSSDCATSLEEIVSYSKRNGLDGIAVTDHNTVEGALKLNLRKDTGLIIIPGIEVSTNHGHILGINLVKPIPEGLSLAETAERIHEAGGIAVAAHPSAIYKNGVGLDDRIASLGIDAIEVVNSAAFPFSLSTRLSRRFAERLNLPQTGGSDSHLPETIGLGHTVIENNETEPDITDILEFLKEGKTVPSGKAIPWTLRIKKITQKKEIKWGKDHLDS